MAPPQDLSLALEAQKRPVDRAIAFAVAIVSSKPDELTVRDYITLLRQHVAKGRRENALSAAYRHLDRSAWWRSECDRVKEALRMSEAATVDGLREAELLKAKLELAKAAAASPTKRKRADPDVVLAPRSPKKARRDASPPRNAFGVLEMETEFEAQGAGAGTQELMRALCMLNTYLKPGIGVEREAASMTYYIIRAAFTISHVVTENVDQKCRSDASDDGSLKATLTASGRVSAAIIVSFTRLFRAKDATSLQGQVIHALVKMFDKLIDTLAIVSTAETVNPTTNETSTSSTASATKKAKPRAHNRVNIQDHPTLNLLTSFLSDILKQLDAKHESHRSLFEGFMFVIISKLGIRLHLLAFHHVRPDSIESSIRNFQEDTESEASTPRPSAPEDPALRQAKLEAPYLLHLLKHSLSLAPTFLDTTISPTKSGKAKGPSKPGNVSKANLSLAARERLQRTLVNAVFGTEGLGEDNDMFLECLKMPVLMGAKVPTPKVKEAEVGDWFREEVWRLLGWEVLGKEVEM